VSGWRGVLCGVLLGVATARAQEFETDAWCAGRGGLWVLGRVEDSPGGPGSQAWEVDFDAWVPYAGSELAGGAIRAERSTNRWRGAVRFAQLRSPVGDLSALALAAAVARHTWRAGAALECRSLALDALPTLWTPVVRLGLGTTLGMRVRVAGVLTCAPPGEAASGAALAADAALLPGVQWGVQVDKVVGSGSEMRLGVALGSGPLRWLAGFDADTQALSVGLGWNWDRQRVAWGARTHPDLGWSHWWSYACGSLEPGSQLRSR
jgi:hypothetical protein